MEAEEAHLASVDLFKHKHGLGLVRELLREVTLREGGREGGRGGREGGREGREGGREGREGERVTYAIHLTTCTVYMSHCMHVHVEMT